MELNLSHSVSADNSTIEIKVGGRLAIDTAPGLIQLLTENSRCHSTRVDLSALQEIDLSGLQLLCSACRTALNESRIFHIAGLRPAAISNIIGSAGVDSQKTCRQHPEIQCIWYEGAN